VGDGGNSSFHIFYDEKAEKFLIGLMSFPAKPAIRYERPQFQGILDAVRNIVLEWSLKLEGDGILGEGMSSNESEKQAASSASHNITNYIHQVIDSQVQVGTTHSVMNVSLRSLRPPSSRCRRTTRWRRPPRPISLSSSRQPKASRELSSWCATSSARFRILLETGESSCSAGVSPAVAGASRSRSGLSICWAMRPIGKPKEQQQGSAGKTPARYIRRGSLCFMSRTHLSLLALVARRRFPAVSI
jgi:hypothetical protein